MGNLLENYAQYFLNGVHLLADGGAADAEGGGDFGELTVGGLLFSHRFDFDGGCAGCPACGVLLTSPLA